MSLGFGPNTVMSGLVFNLDAGNIRSYPAGLDPYISNVTLVLDGESLVDQTANLRTFTAAGSAAVSTANKKFGSSSIYCTGSGGSRIYNASMDSSFTGDFTIEFWAYHNSFSTANNLILIGNEATGRHALYITSAGKVNVDLYGTGSAAAFNTTISTGVWNHYALVRSGTSVKLFVNGVVDTATGTISGTFGRSGGVYIGADSGGANSSNGYFDDIRITSGVARYSSNFNVPLTALPLPSKIYDLSTNKAIGSFNNIPTYSSSNQGRIAFSGASVNTIGPGITIPYNINYDLSTANFTIEAWCYPTASAFYGVVIGRWSGYGATGNTSWCLRQNNTSQFQFAVSSNGSTETAITDSQAFTNSTWYHLVGVRSGTSLSFYKNGVLLGTTTVSSIYNGAADLTVGYAYNQKDAFTGSVASAKIYKGTALTATQVLQNYNSTKGRFGG